MNIYIYGILAILLIKSLIICYTVYKEVYQTLSKEYKRREYARQKYNVEDPEAALGILGKDFYYPEVVYKDIVHVILVWGIPVVNLVFFFAALILVGISKAKEKLNSPVLPWR